MQKHWGILLSTAMVVVFCGVLRATAADPNGGQSQPVTQDSAKIIQDLTLVGATVLDPQGQKLGQIKHVVLDPQTGQATFVVLDAEAAGGHAMFVVPYPALHVNFNTTDNRQSVVINRRPEQLRSAPQIQNNQWQMLQNSQFREQVRNFYQVTAYYAARPIDNSSMPAPSLPSVPNIPPSTMVTPIMQPSMPMMQFSMPAYCPAPQRSADSGWSRDLDGFYNE